MLQRILTVLVFLSLMPAAAFAGFDEGKKAYDKKDWPTAIKELRPLAEAGDDRAMIILGNMYNAGYGVIPSHKEAMSLYKRAATEKNNPQAMDVVGAMYFSALGVDQNIQTALQWFRRSAMLGDQTGAFFYATILFEGNKTDPNKLDPDVYNAYKWYKIAATENDNAVFKKDAATFARAIAEKKLTTDQVAKADKEVADWKPTDVTTINETLGPVPVDPPQAPPAPVRDSSPTSSSPLLKSPDISLPHSDPLPKQ